MLFSYRTTPNSTTGHSSAELFPNERPKTRLDLLKLDLGRKIETKENGQKTAQNAHSKVFLQNFRGEQKWLEAVTIERAGSVSYTVQIYEEIAKRHVDQILSRKDSGKSKKVNKDNYIDFSEYYMISPSSNQIISEATNDSPPYPRHPLTARMLKSQVIQL